MELDVVMNRGANVQKVCLRRPMLHYGRPRFRPHAMLASRTHLLRAFARPGIALIALLLVVVRVPALAGAAAIASAHPLATAAGHEILQQGGNAFDAAVAVAAALGVVEPYASGLGGGGFFLLHRASDGKRIMLDARETAPGRATRTMYLDAEGKPKGRLSLDGALAAGIPGTPAALALLAQQWGRLPLSAALGPAIRLAREGFAIDSRYVSAAGFREGLLKSDAAVARIFLDNGQAPKAGFVVRQPELAATLEALAAKGRDGFYAGVVAQRLVAGVKRGGGIWELEDLAGYRVIEREPASFSYRGARITCAALPSSGGLVLAQALQILERFALPTLSRVKRDHLVVEALRRGYQDRARYLGDPDFVSPPPQLGTRAYADERALSIDPGKATPSEALDARYPALENPGLPGNPGRLGNPGLREGSNTTHFSIADSQGNLVAATLSVNLPFGAGVLAGDTGVLLNNEMNDFSIGPGVPNAYRLTGDAANAVEPGKRPLSSMTPTFVEDDRGVLALGTPGGSRIISMVLLGILDYVDDPMLDAERQVAAPRFHHQYLPDRIEYEPGAFSAEWIAALQAKGHTVQEGRRRWGNMQAVFVPRATGEASAHGDPRGKSGVLF
jgi:gamma-glutamyltranspeptidase/glutathione hydrolase